MSKIPNPTDEYVGQRVRMRRMMLGMSQEKLGNALRLTFQQVQKYEKGTNRIGASRLQQIATILTVPVSFFFEHAPNGGEGAPAAAGVDVVTEMLTTPHGLELAQAFVAIESARQRAALAQIAAGLVSQAAALRSAA